MHEESNVAVSLGAHTVQPLFDHLRVGHEADELPLV